MLYARILNEPIIEVAPGLLLQLLSENQGMAAQAFAEKSVEDLADWLLQEGFKETTINIFKGHN